MHVLLASICILSISQPSCWTRSLTVQEDGILSGASFTKLASSVSAPVANASKLLSSGHGRILLPYFRPELCQPAAPLLSEFHVYLHATCSVVFAATNAHPQQPTTDLPPCSSTRHKLLSCCSPAQAPCMAFIHSCQRRAACQWPAVVQQQHKRPTTTSSTTTSSHPALCRACSRRL